ncbi:polysaccharide deacetylase family protein [Pseudochryseolinea flava]|uniref:Polysaccharide deacetylase family protein n=1 Tax=Pseudochryseolinea flava TaxID=2059302 RepID=A0A364Y2G2_9BACT|nr:polysaccharide deacetylase family protein [Pseudochryseolinea flava]RAW00150.1 polysaccharide deacetylase family protein [Pseudochryseolinea flava]
MPRHKVVDLLFLVVLGMMMIAEMITDIPWIWYAVLVAFYIALCSFGAFILSMQFFTRVRWKGDVDSNAIAITFDDGPVDRTAGILKILGEHQVPATFFCIGSRIEGNEALLLQINNAGHLIGNHSFYHGKTFDLMSAQSVINELTNTDRKIESVIGKRPRYFRPPYGVTNPMIGKAVEELGHTVVGWNVRSFDTITKDPARLLKRVTKDLKGGDVVLFHDYCESTQQILGEFITMAHQKGLRIISLDALLNEKAYR